MGKHPLPEFDSLPEAQKKNVDRMIEKNKQDKKIRADEEWKMQDQMKESLMRDLGNNLDQHDKTQLYGRSRIFSFPELYKGKKKK